MRWDKLAPLVLGAIVVALITWGIASAVHEFNRALDQVAQMADTNR